MQPAHLIDSKVGHCQPLGLHQQFTTDYLTIHHRSVHLNILFIQHSLPQTWQRSQSSSWSQKKTAKTYKEQFTAQKEFTAEQFVRLTAHCK
jgi:hypothetical protein